MCFTPHCPTDQLTAGGTWVQAIAASLTFLVAIVAAGFAWFQVREARRLREDQAAPFVTFSLDVWNQSMGDAVLLIENQGSTPAKNITFTFLPPFESTLGTDALTAGKIWTSGIPTLVPHQRLRIELDSFALRFRNENLPRSYRVDVEYYGVGKRRRAKSYRHEYTIDFDIFIGHVIKREKNDDRLVKAVERGMHSIAHAINPKASRLGYISSTTSVAEPSSAPPGRDPTPEAIPTPGAGLPIRGSRRRILVANGGRGMYTGRSRRAAKA